MSSAEVNEVSKEIGRYEVMTGAKINHEKSVGLQLGSLKGDNQRLVQSRSPTGEKLVRSI